MSYKHHIEGVFQCSTAVFDFTVTSAATLISHISLGSEPVTHLWGLTALLERYCAHTDAAGMYQGSYERPDN